MRGKKKKEETGKNVKIPIKEFEIIRQYAKINNYKIGGFVATAAIEKIEREKQK